FSNDASLLVPVHALDTDYRFIGVPTWSINRPSPAGLAVVAPTDGIDVTVRLPARGAVLPEPSGRVRRAGSTLTVRLDAQEVLLLQTDSVFFGAQPDLTGAQIQATAPVAVFSSHQCAFYPELQGACDHVEEQLFPVTSWGEEFVLVPPVRRAEPGGVFGSTEAVYWKIQAQAPGARITLSRPWNQLAAVAPGFQGVPDCANFLQGDDTLVLNGEGHCEFGTMQPVSLTSDTSLMIMGIISGQESTGVASAFGARAGDPAIFLVPPARQYRNDYAFLAPDTYANDFVTVVTAPGNNIGLDGVPLNLADAVAVPGSEVVYKHLSISDGPHRLQGDGPFGILVFAFDDFVSYAFAGGLNLRKR
ncbi:MAG: IgGFc-binding protein, partial [Myxococcales bacterium]|nr:IgGFc-binding protein [Myxococcales bacterium]